LEAKILLELRVYSNLRIISLFGNKVNHFMKLFFLITILILTFVFIFKHKRIETNIIINQPIDHVWGLFQCTSTYSEWNTLFSIEQFPKNVGQKLIVDLYDENRNVQFKMKPEVKKLEKYRLEWEGKLFVNGLFNGRHQFIFKKIDDNTTELVQAEDFNGLLVPILNYFIIQSTKLNFEKMNQSFKQYADSHVLKNTSCKAP